MEKEDQRDYCGLVILHIKIHWYAITVNTLTKSSQLFKQIWYFIFAVEITEEYSLTTNDLPLIGENNLVYQSLIGNGTVTYINNFDVSSPLNVPVCNRENFQTWTMAPVMSENSWVLLGETSKYIKMSEQRVSDLTVTSNQLIVQLHGSPQEVVTMAAIDTKDDITTENVEYFKCTIPDDGETTLYIPNGWC